MTDHSAGAIITSPQTIKNWEYSVVTIHARHDDLLEQALKERGLEGWELIHVTIPVANDYQCIFKRPAP